jgi:2-amino-4-hydroxy-6-hydroxymethyldihydropteridine diphosphokinase
VSDSSSGATSAGPIRAFLGLGSNLGDRRAHLRRAVELLQADGDFVAVSPVYETDPVGGPPGQGAYLNVVVELRTDATARQLLDRCARLERDAQRVRTVRFGPRTLDVDVLLVGSARVEDADLVVPHPRMYERRFVLAPLADLAPDLVTPDVLAAALGTVSKVGTL